MESRGLAAWLALRKALELELPSCSPLRPPPTPDAASRSSSSVPGQLRAPLRRASWLESPRRQRWQEEAQGVQSLEPGVWLQVLGPPTL